MNIEDIHKHLLEIDKLLDSLKSLKTCNIKQAGGQPDDVSDTSNDVDEEVETVKSIDYNNQEQEGGHLDLPDTGVKNIDPDFSMSIMAMM